MTVRQHNPAFDRDGCRDDVFGSTDWSETSVGTPMQWSQSLTTVAGIIFRAREPMLVCWGIEETLIYNEAFAGRFAERRFALQGRSFAEVFSEHVDVDAVREAIQAGESARFDDLQSPTAADAPSPDLLKGGSGTPVYGEDGEVAGFLATGFDALEDDEASTAGAGVDGGGPCGSEDRYRGLFQRVEQGVCILEMIFDEDGNPVDYRFLETNPAFVEQTGIQNPVGKTADELTPDLDDFWFETYGRVATTGEPTRFENHAESMGRWFEVYAFPVEEPEKSRVALLFSDITSRKRRELNADFIAEINDDFARLTGFEEIMRVVAEKVSKFLDVSRVTFSELHESGESTTNIYDHHEPGLSDATGEFSLSDFLSDEFIDQLRAGEAVVIDDVTEDSRTSEFAEAYREFSVGAEILVPHRSDDRWRFLLAVYHRQPHQWRRHEVELVRELTAQLWYRLERARAEEALRNSQQRLHRALSAAQMVAWEWDRKRDQIETFPESEADLDLPFRLDVENIETAHAMIHPDDIDDHLHTQQQALKNCESYVSVYRVERPDRDGWMWVEESGRADVHRDGGSRLVGVARDITERKRAERRLAEVTREAERRRRLHQAIMSSTPDLVYVFDLDYRILFANDALLKMWGKTWEESVDRRLHKLGYEDWHAEMHEREIDQIVATGEPVRGEVPFEGTEGRRIYDYLMVPVFDDDGQVEAVAGTTRDITERKRAEEALLEADRRKDRFLATLSHELRNPLAPIRLSLHLLEEASPGTETENKARETIGRQVDQLTRLVDDLLDVTRITRDKITLDKRRLELGELTDRSVDDHRALFEANDIDLRYEPPKRSVFVDADSNRLSQVIGNLLQNAAKFTEPEDRVTVSVRPDITSDKVEIHVVDTGIGIGPETIETLFEPFAQADVSLDRSRGGLGLGLALVQGLVDLHGGEVDVHSEGVGQGAEFVVCLPAKFEERPQPESTEITADSRGRRILIIEDNPDVADSLQMVLELKGHEVEVADEGSGGLEKARDLRPDVIICDIGLPGMDGFEIATAIADDPELSSIYLIALSGYARPEDIEKSKNAGFDYHLAKPPDIGKIDDLLGGLDD